MIFADSTVNEWVPIASAVAQLGFSGFVAWFLLVKAMPVMQDKFGQMLQMQRTDTIGALRDQRLDFLTSVKDERNGFIAALAREREQFTEMLEMMSEGKK